MANITKYNYYKKMRCGNCGYLWDYPFSNRNAMSDLQNLFYFEINYCPNCYSLSDLITSVDKFELDIQKDKRYKEIIKNRNEAFGMTCRKEAYKYLLFAYICECKNDDMKASQSYYMASKVERFQRHRYKDSMIYNEQKDAKMLQESIEKENEYMRKALLHMERYVRENPENIDARIMLAVLYKLNSDGDNAILSLNTVMKMDVNQTQINMVKDVIAMELGPSDFLKQLQ